MGTSAKWHLGGSGVSKQTGSGLLRFFYRPWTIKAKTICDENMGSWWAPEGVCGEDRSQCCAFTILIAETSNQSLALSGSVKNRQGKKESSKKHLVSMY